MQKQKKAIFTTKMLTSCALLAALSVVLARFFSIAPDPSTRYSIETVPLFLTGLLFGPIPGALVGFTADFVGCMFSTQGAYNPLFSVPFISYGLCAGLMRNYICAKPNLWRLTLGWLPPVVVGSILYQSAAFAFFYGKGTYFARFLGFLISRSIQYPITMVACILVVYLLCKSNIFKRIGLWPEGKDKT